MTWIVIYQDGRRFEVSETTGPVVAQRVTEFSHGALPDKLINIPRLDGTKESVLLSELDGAYPVDLAPEPFYICHSGQRHPIGKECDHPKLSMFGGNTAGRGRDVSKEPTIPRERWDQARSNMRTLIATGRYGTEGVTEEEVDRITTAVQAARIRREANAAKYGPPRSRHAMMIQDKMQMLVNAGDE